MTYSIDQLKQAQEYERQKEALSARDLKVSRSQEEDGSGNKTGVVAYNLTQSNGEDNTSFLGVVPESMVKKIESGSGDNNQVRYTLDRDKYLTQKLGFTPPKEPYSKMLTSALDQGVDLRPLYGSRYADAVQFKKDLGQYRDKDTSLIIPANPVGFKGGFKFDPNYGSEYYRQVAEAVAPQLGLSPEQMNKAARDTFSDAFYSGDVKGTVGFTDFGSQMLDNIARQAGMDPAQAKQGPLQQFYGVTSDLHNQLNNAASIESQSSGVLKSFGQDMTKLPAIIQIGLNAASGGAWGIGTNLAQGNFLDAAKSYALGEALGGLQEGGLTGLKDTIAGIPGNVSDLFSSVGDTFDGLFGGSNAANGLSAGVAQPNSSFSLAEGYTPSYGLDAGAQGISGLTPPSGFDINPDINTSFIDAAYTGATSPSSALKPLLGLGGGLALLSNTGFGRDLMSSRSPQGAQPTYGTPTDGVVNPNDPNAVGAYSGPAYQGYTGPNYGNMNTAAMQRPTKRSFNQGGIASLGRMVNGAGDGMSDHVDATIDGQEPINIADGEYIIPAQAVSALGNGSSNAGAKVLDGMVKKIYTEQTGNPKQMKKLPIGRVLPV